MFWSDGPVKILGVYISPHPLEAYSYNYIDMLEQVQDICNTWSTRSLNLFGKITVINTLIVPRFIHKFMALPTPHSTFFNAYKTMILDFLWNHKPHRIVYNKLVQGYDRMGLKLVDLQTKNTALKAAWPSRWSDRIDTKWFYTHLPIKDSRVWEVNLVEKDVYSILGDTDLSHHSP